MNFTPGMKWPSKVMSLVSTRVLSSFCRPTVRYSFSMSAFDLQKAPAIESRFLSVAKVSSEKRSYNDRTLAFRSVRSAKEDDVGEAADWLRDRR